MTQVLIRALQVVAWASLLIALLLFLFSLFSIEVSVVLGAMGLAGGVLLFLVYAPLALLLRKVEALASGPPE